jgi:hypothetical protein
MNSHLIADTIIHQMFSFLFTVIFFWITGLMMLVVDYEEVPSPKRNTSRLHIMLGPQLDA